MTRGPTVDTSFGAVLHVLQRAYSNEINRHGGRMSKGMISEYGGGGRERL